MAMRPALPKALEKNPVCLVVVAAGCQPRAAFLDLQLLHYNFFSWTILEDIKSDQFITN